MLNQAFIEQYMNLPVSRKDVSYGRNYHYIVDYWGIKKEQKIHLLQSDEAGMQFIWQSVLFNLFSKTVYNYYPQSYRFCNDFIDLKYGYDKVMCHLFKAPFKNLMDEEMGHHVPADLFAKFYTHSKNNMDSYVKQWVDLFEFFDSNGCELDVHKIMNKALTHFHFTSEFSSQPESLSYLFYATLKKQFQ
jgi:hypothetical protein